MRIRREEGDAEAEDKPAPKKMSTGAKVAIGVGLTALGGLLLWAATREGGDDLEEGG